MEVVNPEEPPNLRIERQGKRTKFENIPCRSVEERRNSRQNDRRIGSTDGLRNRRNDDADKEWASGSHSRSGH